MKKTILIGSAVVIAASAYLALSPYLALRGLRTAIESRDSAELEDRIDFPRVREDLKGQLNVVMLKKMGSELKDNPFGVLGLALASKVVDAAVDSYITPTGLAGLARGDRKPSEATGEPAQPVEEPFANSRLTRESLDRFSVWVPTRDGRQARFVFRWSGLRWMLTGITVPMDDATT
jgi:hypothetical protein